MKKEGEEKLDLRALREKIFRNFMLINKRNIVGNYEKMSVSEREKRRCQPHNK